MGNPSNPVACAQTSPISFAPRGKGTLRHSFTPHNLCFLARACEFEIDFSRRSSQHVRIPKLDSYLRRPLTMFQVQEVKVILILGRYSMLLRERLFLWVWITLTARPWTLLQIRMDK